MTPKQEILIRLAREAMEDLRGYRKGIDVAIAAIDEALADNALDKMADNAKELGLDYEPIVEQVEDSVGMGHGAWDMVEPKKLAKAFHEALTEPREKYQYGTPLLDAMTGKTEQPAHVAAVNTSSERVDKTAENVHEQPAQPSKPWVGLTEEEVDECYYWKGRQWTTDELVRHVEAKLREKNNG